MVGIGTDGASNMMGKNNGMCALLKRDHPEVMSVHCLNHRLELAFKDAIKVRVKAKYDRLLTLLLGLHYLYEKSYKMKTGLQEAFIAVQCKGLLIPKATGTRWLPHTARAITAVLRSFTALEHHLSSASHFNAKAEGLVKIMLQREMMAFILWLNVSIVLNV